MTVSPQGICLAQLSLSASHPTRHHTENTEITQKHGKYKKSVGLDRCSTLPSPHTEPTEFNGIHGKGAGGGGMGDLLFSKEDSFHPFSDSWGRNTAAGVLEGFAPGFANQRFGRKSIDLLG